MKNHLIFQHFDSHERRETIRWILEQTEGTVVIVSPSAAALANESQPVNRRDRPTIRLLRHEGSGVDTFDPVDALRILPERHFRNRLQELLRPLTEDSPKLAVVDLPSSLAREPSWRAIAAQLLEVLVHHVVRPKKNGTLPDALKYVLSDGIKDTIASLSDDHLMDPIDRSVIKSFTIRTDQMQCGILGLICLMTSQFDTSYAHRAFERTTFDFATYRNGANVFIESPYRASDAFGFVTRIWLTALLQLASNDVPERFPATIIVDEPAPSQLFTILDDARRSPGESSHIWSIWESVEQLRSAHPREWSAFVNGCHSVHVCGEQGVVSAHELSSTFGLPQAQLMEMRAGDRHELRTHENALSVSPRQQTRTREHKAIITTEHRCKWFAVADAMRERPEQSVVVIETAGACYDLTAATRQGPVYRLDPFEILGESSHSFNPIDQIHSTSGRGMDVYHFAELLAASGVGPLDEFWRTGNVCALRAILQYILAVPEKTHNIPTLFDVVHSDDMVYNLAVVLDTIGKRLPGDCYRAIAALLSCPDSHRARQIHEICACLSAYSDPTIRKVVATTAIHNLDSLFDEGATVYIEMPYSMASRYGAVVRLWLGVFLALARNGIHKRNSPPLIVVENPHGLALLRQLHEAQIAPEGTVVVHAFWESLAQIEAGSPTDRTGYLGNCELITTEAHRGVIAREVADKLGVPNTTLPTQTRQKDEARSLKGAVSPQPTDFAYPDRGHHISFTRASTSLSSKYVFDKWSTIKHIVVVESAGELFKRNCSHDRRQSLQLDPCGVISETSSAFNPFDILTPTNPTAYGDRFRFAEAIVGTGVSTLDPFWRNRAFTTLGGVMGYLSGRPNADLRPSTLLATFSSKDVAYDLATALDKHGKQLPPEVYQQIASFLQDGEGARGSILTDIRNRLHVFGDPKVAEATGESSFRFQEFGSGEPSTIYIELPVDRFRTHQVLLELWVLALLRSFELTCPAQRPLFIVDQPFAAALFPLLHAAQLTNKVDIHTSWCSLDQMRIPYSADWSTFVSSANHVEAIGPLSRFVARDLADTFSVSREILESLSPGQSVTLQRF